MITLAKEGMRTDLEYIWRSSFDDGSSYIRYFFDNRYDPNNCAVYIDEATGRAVAMLHMLPCTVSEDGGLAPAQYIYAAATREDHRGRGIMRMLLEYARRCAELRGQTYMVLVPGSRSLFRYYEKNGFYNCFYNRRVYMNREDLTVLISRAESARVTRLRRTHLSVSDVSAVRRDVLVDREGYVNWDTPAIHYAAGAHIFAGGSVITEAEENEAGYAFCDSENGNVRVSEFVAHSGLEARLIKDIMEAYPECGSFEFRLPVFDEFFSSFGDIEPFGMIRSSSGRKPINLLTLSERHLPYLGLPLD